MLLSAVGLMAFTACADDKYDLGDLDTTIGVGSEEGLTLPTSSTRQIYLRDLLDLDDSDNVIIKENGDYAFVQESGEVETVKVSIDKIWVTENQSLPISLPIDLGIDLPAQAVGQTIIIPAGSISGEIYELKYSGEKPEEIKSLTSVDTEGHFDVNILFSENLPRFIPNFKTFKVEFPEYMEIETPDNPSYKEGNSTVIVSNVQTDKPLVVKVEIKRLNVDGKDLKIDDKEFMMNGAVNVSVEWDAHDVTLESTSLDGLELNSAMEIKDLAINGAKGSFSPRIELNDLGDVTIGELPDFLTEDGVKLDIYNPQIVIDIESTLPVAGYLDGTLEATLKDGGRISVNIPPVTIKANDTSRILICRNKAAIEDYSAYTDVQDAELDKIISALPNISTISFKAVAGSDPVENSEIYLGKEYFITPSYTIEAPLAFGAGAEIVYSDTWDGWNEDLEDLDFANSAYVSVTADIINRIPAYLTMDAQAIDVNGNPVNGVTVDVVGNIAASADGETPAKTPISITIKQDSKNALKNVDGLVFTIAVAASDANKQNPIEGITLNADKHSLLADNIKVTIKGKVVIDTDD